MSLLAQQQRGGTVLLHLLLFHVCWTNLAIYIMFFRGIYCLLKRDGASHNLLPTERTISLGSELQQGLTGSRFAIQSVCLDKLLLLDCFIGGFYFYGKSNYVF